MAHYLKFYKPDGEIIFLAADPDCKINGIDTVLLHALESKEKGILSVEGSSEWLVNFCFCVLDITDNVAIRDKIVMLRKGK